MRIMAPWSSRPSASAHQVTIPPDGAYYPNLVAHAFAVMGMANSRDDYSPRLVDIRRRFVSAVERLVGLAPAFAFKPPVAGGPMFSFIYQIPAGVGARDLAETRKVYATILQCIDTGNLNPLFAAYPDVQYDWREFYAEPWLDYMFSSERGRGSPPSLCRDEANSGNLAGDFSASRNGDETRAKKTMVAEFLDFLAALASDHFDSWWNDWHNAICDRADSLQKRLAPLDLIAAWEGLLGHRYPFAGFSILLSIPDKTWASSVAPDAIVVGTRLPDDRIVASALHEVGVRMLHPHLVLHRLPGVRSLSDYEYLLKCMEAAVCVEKQTLATNLGIADLVNDDPFVRSMCLETLLDEWRATRGETSLDRLVEMFGRTSRGRC